MEQWLLLTIVLLVANVNYALIVYDCRGPNTNISVLSAKDVANCPDPENDYTEVHRDIQIIQKNDFSGVHVKTCLVEVTRIIQRCGMFSHVSAVPQGLLSYVHRVGSEECKNIHQSRSFYGFKGHIIGDIQTNGTTVAGITMAGSVTTEGKCKGTTYTESTSTWEDVVVLATVKISIYDYRATVKLASDEIVLKGGVTCSYVSGYCMDTEIGETVWEVGMRGPCDSKAYHILYEGGASLITTNKTQMFLDTRYIVVEQQNRVFAITLREKSFVCDQEAWGTEHPKLMVIEKKTYGFKFRLTEQLGPENIDLLTYINTKFMYVEQSIKKTLHNFHVQTIHRRCLLNREVLKNRLLVAPLSTNAVGVLLKNQLGYTGRVLGEVIYLMQCVPKVAEIRRVNQCYNELPVSVNNESLFMAPVTHILQERAEQIECSPLTPPLYHIGNRWVGFSPQPNTGIQPDIIKANNEPYPEFQPLQHLSTGGIYSNDEIRAVQNALTFGAERQAVSTIITRKIIGLDTENQGYSTLNLFNSEEIRGLAKKTFSAVWGWFTDIGLFTSSILGIYIIFRLGKYLIGAVLNGLSLYGVLGWSFGLLACLWNTLTVWIIHRHHQRTSQMSRVEEGTQQESGSRSTSEDGATTTIDMAEAGATNESAQGDQKSTIYPGLKIQLNGVSL